MPLSDEEMSLFLWKLERRSIGGKDVDWLPLLLPRERFAILGLATLNHGYRRVGEVNNSRICDV